jgi:hypothetical protein
VNLSDYYRITGTCATNPVTASAAPLVHAAMQGRASTILLPLLYEYGRAVSAYLGQAQVDIEAAALVSGLMLSDGSTSVTCWLAQPTRLGLVFSICLSWSLITLPNTQRCFESVKGRPRGSGPHGVSLVGPGTADRAYHRSCQDAKSC